MKERLKHLPQQPGVYIFKDKEGQVIYVGKAIILRNRVRSISSPRTAASQGKGYDEPGS